MKLSTSVTKHRVSPIPPFKQNRSPLIVSKTQPQTQKFNIAIQQRLKQKLTENEPTHHSTQSASSSHASRERHFFLDQRLRNFHKVLTESLQRHSFLSATRTTQSSKQPKLDQRQSLAKLFGDNQKQQLYQNKRKEKPSSSIKESLPRNQVLSVALSSHSANNLRDMTPSPKQDIKKKANLCHTQISSLLQSAHSGQRILDQSPPTSATKRIPVDAMALFQSQKQLLSGSDRLRLSQSNQFVSQFSSLQAEPSLQLNALYQRIQTRFQAHDQERRQWKQERQLLLNKLHAAEQELHLLRHPDKEILETELPNFNDQSFG